MEHILIPQKRAALIDGKMLKTLRERLNCKVDIKANDVEIEGAPYDEYNAKNVILAFGRGFELEKAWKLLSEEYFLQQIDLRDVFRNKEQMARIKSRLIGTEGRAKEYIESVSGADMAVYGGYVSTIGRIEEVKVADAAIQIIIDGGTHKTAYAVMEKERRKMRESKHG